MDGMHGSTYPILCKSSVKGRACSSLHSMEVGIVDFHVQHRAWQVTACHTLLRMSSFVCGILTFASGCSLLSNCCTIGWKDCCFPGSVLLTLSLMSTIEHSLPSLLHSTRACCLRSETASSAELGLRGALHRRLSGVGGCFTGQDGAQHRSCACTATVPVQILWHTSHNRVQLIHCM